MIAPPAADRGKGVNMSYKGIIIIVLIVLCLIIFFQNTEVVTFRVFFWELSMSRIVMLIFTLIVGVVIGYVIATVRRGKSSGDRV
jgi:putative membrane protein